MIRVNRPIYGNMRTVRQEDRKHAQIPLVKPESKIQMGIGYDGVKHTISAMIGNRVYEVSNFVNEDVANGELERICESLKQGTSQVILTGPHTAHVIDVASEYLKK